MSISPLDSLRDPSAGLKLGRNAKSPEDAARQFEEVLVREFVRNMTKGLFQEGAGGDDTAGWVKAQGSAQADALTDAVTKHLVDSGQMGISELLLAKWATPEGTDRLPGESIPLNDAGGATDLTTEAFLSLRATAHSLETDNE